MCKYCKHIQEKHFSDPKEGDLRIYWIPQVPMKPFYYPVTSVKEAKHVLDMLAMYDLFQLKHNIKPDYCNAGGLEIYEDGNWCEWYNEFGEGIDEVDGLEEDNE